jgi:hypothetical protein
MMKYRVAGCLVLLVALGMTLTGCSRGTNQTPPEGPDAAKQAVNKTPQEAFDAAKKAVARDDWKGFCATLTDDSRDTLAVGMVMMPLMLKGFAEFAPPEQRKAVLAKFKPLDDVMTKHGLTEAALAGLKDTKPAGKDPEAMKEAFKKLLTPVKDRSAFVAEMFAALKQMDPKQAGQGPLSTDAELKDVSTDGDNAKGMIVTKKGGQEKREPVAFRRVDGSWKIDLPLDTGVGQAKGRP